MEDQGKRLMLAVVAVFLIMMVWTTLFPPAEKKEEPADDKADAAQLQQGADGDKPAADPAAAAAAAAAVEPEQPRGDEKFFEFKFDDFHAKLSNYGASLVSWELQGKQFEDRTSKEPAQIDLVNTGDHEQLRPFTVDFPNSTHAIPAKTEWEVVRRTDKEIEFSWSSSDIEVHKTYVFHPEDYLLSLTVHVRKLSEGEANQALEISLFRQEDPAASTGGGMMDQNSRAWTSACFFGEDVEWYSAKTLVKSEKTFAGNIYWAGFQHNFFLAAIAPQLEKNDRLTCTGRAGDPKVIGAMEMAVAYPFISNLKKGDTYEKQVTAFFGPKYLDRLDAVPDIIDYDPRFEESVDLGWFSFIGRPLIWLLKKFHTVVGNWGVAIIMLTFAVMAVTLPWQSKSMRSMRAMSKLRPEIEKLQKKYEGDKQRIQVETMSLYKANGVNPLAGCLPMLLQMPIWFALYRSLDKAAELYQSPFIPGWLDDMTAPDPYYILPVALIAMMFVQTRLTPTTADSAQQKIMMYGMPIMFGVFSLFFPSGLTVYIFTSTALRAGHQLWLRRTDEANDNKQVAAAAAAGNDNKPEQSADDDESDDADDDALVANGPKSDANKGKKRTGKRKKSARRRGGARG